MADVKATHGAKSILRVGSLRTRGGSNGGGGDDDDYDDGNGESHFAPFLTLSAIDKRAVDRPQVTPVEAVMEVGALGSFATDHRHRYQPGRRRR